MKIIFVAVDLLHDAGQVLARAAQLSAQHGAAVAVYHVIENMDTEDLEIQEALDQYARKTLGTLVGEADFDRAPSLKIVFGVPHRCVTTAAHAMSADIILIGPGQPSTVMQHVFGSTADRIVRTAQVPVLVVRNKSVQQYRNVAIAMDFSPLSEAALEAALFVAPDAGIDLVHAYEVPLSFEQAMLRSGTRPEDAEHFWQVKMNDYRRRLMELERKCAVGARASILRGAPGAALVKLSRSGCVDLMALGTQGQNALAQALLGSVARRLLSESGCDVLVVGRGLKNSHEMS